MELHEAKQIHAQLVSKRNDMFVLHKNKFNDIHNPAVAAELAALDRQIGRYAQAFNPRIAAKALAFFQS